MARPKKKIDPECGKRVQEWINECQIKQYELADLLGIEKESMNNIIKGRRNLTYENAVEISKKVVKYENETPVRILPEYLMNQTKTRTTHDKYLQCVAATEQWQMNSGLEMNGCAHDLIEAAIKNICLDKWESEGLETDKIIEKHIENDFPVLPEDDFMLIKNLVVDYAYSLVYSRLNNEKNQPLWLYVRGQRLKEL